jgi:hypothetical protein
MAPQNHASRYLSALAGEGFVAVLRTDNTLIKVVLAKGPSRALDTIENNNRTIKNSNPSHPTEYLPDYNVRQLKGILAKYEPRQIAATKALRSILDEEIGLTNQCYL